MKRVDKDIIPGKCYLVIVVNVYNGNSCKHASVAIWYPQWFKEDESDYEGDCDYHEENDVYYWPEGWYEQTYEADISYIISGTVTHYEEINWPSINEIEDAIK